LPPVYAAAFCSPDATVPRGGCTTQQLAPARVEEGAGDGRSRPLPPYDLRHAFASQQIRAGMSIPELAEQLGHSPQMTVMTYTHVIRVLKGEPRISAEKQIKRARHKARGPQVDPKGGCRSA
jgi:integrase